MSKFNTKEMKDSSPSKGNKKERKEDAVDVFMGMYKERTSLVLNDIKMNQPFGQGRGPGILEDIGIDYKTAGAGAASLKGLCLDKITSDDKLTKEAGAGAEAVPREVTIDLAQKYIDEFKLDELMELLRTWPYEIFVIDSKEFLLKKDFSDKLRFVFNVVCKLLINNLQGGKIKHLVIKNSPVMIETLLLLANMIDKGGNVPELTITTDCIVTEQTLEHIAKQHKFNEKSTFKIEPRNIHLYLETMSPAKALEYFDGKHEYILKIDKVNKLTIENFKDDISVLTNFLSKFPQVKRLGLRSSLRLRNRISIAFKDFGQNLEYLDLTCTGLINKDIIFLGTLVNLKHVILSYMKLKDKGEALARMLKTLEKLEIFEAHESKMTTAVKMKILPACETLPNFHSIDIKDSYGYASSEDSDEDDAYY